jgi:prevent-host-death family protein
MRSAVHTWQLQTAKNKFSELVANAMAGSAQLVTRNGRPAVYVISADKYKRISGKKHNRLKKLLLSKPHKDIEISIGTRSDSGRKIAL